MGVPGCGYCRDPDDPEIALLPMYGVAPHECFWRKGPEFTIGQSTLIPIESEHCFVPDLEAHEDWSHFVYPSACGAYYCPNCQPDEYRAAWASLVARIGEPPASAMSAREGQDAQQLGAEPASAARSEAQGDAQTPEPTPDRACDR